MMLLPLLLTVLAPQADADVLAPARQGMLRCASPDRARKSCATLTGFTFKSDGSFDAEVTGIGGPAGIQVRYRSTGKMVDGAACFTHRSDTLAEATFTKPNAKLAASVQDALRSQLRTAMAPYNGKQRCYRDRQQGGELISRTTLDGAAHPELDRTVLWVRPEDGYKVQ